jgi:raffinose/stachyose/melibiose transport system substrate-binding protein
MEWAREGKIYSWNQYAFTGEFRDNTLGPIYANFAKTLAGVSGGITKAQFITAMKNAFVANAA